MASEGLFLRVTKGDAAGVEIPLADGLVFGRNAAGDGSLGGDSELSRQHARLQEEPGGGFVIHDLESMNGTYVNGTRITEPTPLRPGDVIQLGASELELAGTLPAAAQPTAVAENPVIPLAAQQTRVAQPAPSPAAEPPAVEPPAAAPPAAGPPPGVPGRPPDAPGPPPDIPGPPPGVPGPPPGVGGPPPGVGGRPKLKDLPPPIAARIRRMAIIAAAVGFLVGLALATIIWQVL
jgi:hypothetical protein